MDIPKEELLERYTTLSDEELIELKARGSLTDLAQEALDSVLDSRGIKVDQREKLVEEAKQTRAPGPSSDRQKVVSSVHTGLAWLYAVVGVILLLVLLLGGLGFGAVFFSTALFSLLFFLHFSIARGAREGKPWARVASIVIAVFMLFGFPVGTILGVILLVNAAPSWE